MVLNGYAVGLRQKSMMSDGVATSAHITANVESFVSELKQASISKICAGNLVDLNKSVQDQILGELSNIRSIEGQKNDSISNNTPRSEPQHTISSPVCLEHPASNNLNLGTAISTGLQDAEVTVAEETSNDIRPNSRSIAITGTYLPSDDLPGLEKNHGENPAAELIRNNFTAAEFSAKSMPSLLASRQNQKPPSSNTIYEQKKQITIEPPPISTLNIALYDLKITEETVKTAIKTPQCAKI
ncbi:hypothetical protein GALMADRAFT_147699 [Galerina marginata CBS 339.88]|uniref:Uncharacterized protein n=1 Tax=Galerina marginata (strain CBS 339.88) TaxID=685588 RepID=A0A067SIR2_GALM3|nr:hypothetical protein GALMADRAFT_147699 [Galerina marginata CBS 339.88]